MSFTTARDNGSRTVLFMGSTGSGRSTLGNFIVGKDVFKVPKRAQLISQQQDSISATCFHHGREVQVIDTPGFCNRRLKKRDDLVHVIGQALLLTRDGAHAICICVNLSCRFSDTDLLALQQIEQLGNMWRYAMVVFMNSSVLGDTAGEQEQALRSLLGDPRQCPERLSDLLRNVNGRYVVLEGSYTENTVYRDQKLTELLDMTDMIFTNNKQCTYNSELFETAKENYDDASAQLRSTTKEQYETALKQMTQESADRERQFIAETERLRQEMAAKDQEYRRKLEETQMMSFAEDQRRHRSMKETEVQRVARNRPERQSQHSSSDDEEISWRNKGSAMPEDEPDDTVPPSNEREQAVIPEAVSDTGADTASNPFRKAYRWIKKLFSSK